MIKAICRYLLFFLGVVLLVSCSPESPSDVNHLAVTLTEPLSWDVKKPVKADYCTKTDTLHWLGKWKCRGGSSSRYYKHSFSIEFSEKNNLAGLPKDDDWILNANYIDKTFMRHKISYDLFREMRETNIAAECAYLTLEIDGDYQGLYVAMEEINGGMIGLNKSDTLAMLFKDPPIFYRDSFAGVQDSGNYFQQKYPKINERNQTNYITAFRDFLFDSADAQFRSEIGNKIDLDNVMDWHLLLLYSNNGDGVMKNFYLYKRDSYSPFEFAIWDYDHSFGREGDNEYNMMTMFVNWEQSILLKRLSEWDRYNSHLRERYIELRKSGVFSNENMVDQVKTIDEIIAPYIDQNFEKWPLNDPWYKDSNSYEEEKEILVAAAALRLVQLDAIFDDE